MECSTSQRLLAVLTFGLIGGTMAFLAGAFMGAAVDGRANVFTRANAPLPPMQAAAIQHMRATPVEVANR
jgi:hypothetical protein